MSTAQPHKVSYEPKQTTLITQIVQSFLGKGLLFACRAVSRAWVVQGLLKLSRDVIRVKPIAYFERASARGIAGCLESLGSKIVFLPMRGGGIQRRLTLEIAQHIQEATRVGRPPLFILDGFFGFLDEEAEAEEISMLDCLRASGVSLVSATGLELFPGRLGKVFASDLFEAGLFEEDFVHREFEFQGGNEELSIRVRNETGRSYKITAVIYDMICTTDFSIACYARLQAIEDRLDHVVFSRRLPLDLVLPPYDTVELPHLSVPIESFGIGDESPSCRRFSLFQRLQVCGHDAREESRRNEVTLVTTGWLHVFGPDGSEGGTIIDAIDNYDEDLPTDPDAESFDLLAETVAGHAGRGILGFNGSWFNMYERICCPGHLMQFRTMQDGDRYRSVVHVYDVSEDASVTDLFAVGSPRGDRDAAREAAAIAARSLLERGTREADVHL